MFRQAVTYSQVERWSCATIVLVGRRLSFTRPRPGTTCRASHSPVWLRVCLAFAACSALARGSSFYSRQGRDAIWYVTSVPDSNLITKRRASDEPRGYGHAKGNLKYTPVTGWKLVCVQFCE